jgi:diguanylate cyclase (GGDEF)-like protein/PAS domain S-box-containing protein
MTRQLFLRSVVFRLVCGLVLGGLAISIGLCVMELRNSEAMLRMDLTQRVGMTVRNIQGVCAGLRDDAERGRNLKTALEAFLGDRAIRAIRVTASGSSVEAGDWPVTAQLDSVPWVFPTYAVARGDEADLDRLTRVRAPFSAHGRAATLEMIVDGPAELAAVRRRVLAEMWGQGLLLAVTLLLGLLFVRRWVTEPLSRVMRLIGAHAGPEDFYRLSRGRRDEFSRLAESVGGMLTRLESTAEQLHKREQAFQNLYQFAPAAMVSLDAQGKILEANNRAAELFHVESERLLVGQGILDFLRTEDRGLLRQTIDRLDLDRAARCELRVLVADKTIDVLVECAGVRDRDGVLQSVHLSFLDVSESKKLQRQLADKSHLLNLVIDHISSAILLVNEQGKVAAHNQHMAALLKRQPSDLIGQAYDPERFWDELGLVKHDLFVNRLRQIEADGARPAQERFEARSGTFLFQGVPVHDASGKSIGRLWVVQEITPQEQSQRLLDQQTSQLQALKRLGPQLGDASDPAGLLERAAKQLFEIFGVEAVGIALRHDEAAARSLQIIHRGQGPYLLETNRALVEAVERQLMPRILSNQDVSFWPEFPRDAAWGKTFAQAGLTCLAGGPLRAGADAQGILWIARRGGERLERHHMYLLEALGPVIAATLETTQLRARMRSAELSDPTTGLPTAAYFDLEMRKLIHRPGSAWALAIFNLDHFRKLNAALDHPAADALLADVATRLLKHARRDCLVARLAGPTFGVLMRDASPERVGVMADRLRQVIASCPVVLPDGSSLELTASVGVAICPEDGPGSGALMELALARVEIAKRSGRNRVVSTGAAPQKLAG